MLGRLHLQDSRALTQKRSLVARRVWQRHSTLASPVIWVPDQLASVICASSFRLWMVRVLLPRTVG
jgi:hypothetical protein